MNAIDYYKKVVVDNYANFDGRARRAEYWQFVLVNLGIVISINFLSFMGGLISDMLYLLIIIFAPIYLVAIFLPSLAVLVRRLHDTDKSGWWVLIGCIPIVGIVIIVFLCMEGTRGPNQFGPDPKGIDGGITDNLV